MDNNNAKQVSVGKPMVGGAVFYAPAGTVAPTDAVTALGNDFVNMGYISDAGVTNSQERESEDIKAWGGDTVLSPQTSKTDTFGMTFIESLNVNVLKAVYGADNVTGSLETGIAIKANSKELDYAVWVIDMIMTDGALKRVVIPNGKITSTGEVTYADNSAVGFETTITGFPDDDTNTHYEYIAKAGESE